MHYTRASKNSVYQNNLIFHLIKYCWCLITVNIFNHEERYLSFFSPFFQSLISSVLIFLGKKMWDILSAYRFAFLFISFLFTFSHMRTTHAHCSSLPFSPFLLPCQFSLSLLLSSLLCSLTFFSSPLFLFSSFYSYNKLIFPNFLSTPVSPASSFCFHSFSISSSVSYLHISMKTYSPFGY